MCEQQARTDQPSTRKSHRPFWVLFILTLIVVIVPLVSIGYPYCRQMALIRRIDSLPSGSPVYLELTPDGPDWLRNIVGDDYMRGFDKVKRLVVWDRRLETNDLSAFSCVRELYLIHSDIDDKQILQLMDIDELEMLYIESADLTDHGLARLAELKNLKELKLLLGPAVTDDGVQQLGRLTSLERVLIQAENVTDKGFDNLRRRLPHCEIFANP